MPVYPVNLKLEGRLCVVIGGGAVAFRKIQGLLEAEAEIQVISPRIITKIQALVDDGRVSWLARDFAKKDLQQAGLVFAATDNQAVQEMIAKQAAACGALLNSATDPKACDFHIPAHFRRGDLLLSVSTGGGSPALARLIRRRLEAEFPPQYEEAILLLGMIRRKVLAAGLGPEMNKPLFRSLLDDGLVELVLEKAWHPLEKLLHDKLPKDVDVAAILSEFQKTRN